MAQLLAHVIKSPTITATQFCLVCDRTEQYTLRRLVLGAKLVGMNFLTLPNYVTSTAPALGYSAWATLLGRSVFKKVPK